MKICTLLKKMLFLFFLSPAFVFANVTIEKNGWIIAYDEETRTFDYSYNGTPLFLGVSPEAKYDDGEETDIAVMSSSYANISLSEEDVIDQFGRGTLYTVNFTNPSSDVYMQQKFYFYDSYEYFITELSVITEGEEEIKSNYLAPIATTTTFTVLPRSTGNRMIMVPWSNEGFSWYECNPLTKEMTSYGATSIYNGNTRTGLVIGAITHDTWKNAIRVKANNDTYITDFCCYSGASAKNTSADTWDVLPHGKVKGSVVSSAKMLVGYYDDWREGMEAYGHANTLMVPARTGWEKGNPIGWNSWGVLACNINFQILNDVSAFISDYMYDEGFYNDQGYAVVGIDACWTNLSNDHLTLFASRCKSRNQIPAIYHTPFSLWWDSIDENSGESEFRDGYKIKDVVLKVNGNYLSQGGFCLDPTHPAVQNAIKDDIANFKRLGFEYVKLDFVMNAAIQADSYYDPEVTTAVQAYNQGFKVLDEAAGDDMYIALSIAPMFPYQYGNSRRISCDAWGTIGHSEYVMNALTYGWWTDQFNQYNDPDHLVLQSADGGETVGENRARLTTGAVSGMYLLGDNLTSLVLHIGDYELSRERALEYAVNPDVLEIARLGKSFRPVYGNQATSTSSAEPLVMLDTDEFLYIGAINYSSGNRPLSGYISLEFLGLEEEEIGSIYEVWTGEYMSLVNGQFYYSVPAKDARIYKIKKGPEQGIDSSVKEKQNKLFASVLSDIIRLTSDKPISKVEVYNLQGNLIHSSSILPAMTLDVKISTAFSGIGVVKCYFDDDTYQVTKVVMNN